MLASEKYVQAQHELINAGFQPERFGFLVKLLRRLLWPFIRPFHLFELEKIVELELDLKSQLKCELERFDAQARERFAQFEQSVLEKMERIVKEHVVLRTDVEALKNRYLALESLDDRVTAVGQQAAAHSGQLAVFADRIETMQQHLQGKPERREVDELKASIANMTPRELAITSTPFGLYIGKPGEIISDHIFRGGVWDQHILDLAEEVSRKRNGTALDIGAHLGSVTVGLAGLFKEVVSFEPNDFNFRILNANVAINCLKNVRLFNNGVFSHETTLALGEQNIQEIPISLDSVGGFDGHSAHNLGAYSFSEQEGGVFGHPARTIDSYRFEEVAFLKIDVQGADGEVLMGALDTIRRCKPVIVFEWEEHLSRNFGVTFESLCRSLSDLGYVVRELKVHNEKQVDYVARPAEPNG
jgi:FkbM family methyltransferase